MPDKYYFLNVGCADCTVMHLDGEVVMVDCHQGNSYNGQDDILKYIPNDMIDVLIITHQHYDHFDGIEKLLYNDIEVKKLWECPYKRRYGDNSVEYGEWQNYQKLVKKLVDKGTKIYRPYRGKKIYDTVGGARFHCLNPPKNINEYKTRELHDASLVFSVVKGSMNIIFAGDASDYALQNVDGHFNLKPKHILHASHHGSINGAYLEFIKSVSPNYTFVSTRSGVYDNVPHPTALQRYRRYTKKAVIRTDVDGTKVFNVN